MKRYVPFILAVLLLFTLVAAGCSDKDAVTDEQVVAENTAIKQTVVYYQDEQGFMVPVMRKIPWEEGIAKATLKKMVSTPENIAEMEKSGLSFLLPSTVTFDLDIKDGLARVDIRGGIGATNKAEESNVISAVVNTLCNFPTVEKVQVLIDGRKLDKMKYGTDISKPLTGFDLNQEALPEGVKAKEENKLTLYFLSKTGGFLVPVTRYTAQKANAETAIRELLKGPADTATLDNVFPAGTRLQELSAGKDALSLNFSKEFSDLKSSPDLEKRALKAIMLTVNQYDNTESVIIKVEGKEYEPAGGQETVTTFANEY